jgi:thiol-disulfide isomerase/thioredoxin
MTIRTVFISFCLISSIAAAQKVSGVYKIDALLKRISQPDTLYVVNFWATWCKPCIEELPAFDSLHNSSKAQKIKVLLVSLDFYEELDKKVNPFLKKRNIISECVLLDEINGNEFVNRIDERWSGAIPATLLIKGRNRSLLEKKMTLQLMRKKVAELNK